MFLLVYIVCVIIFVPEIIAFIMYKKRVGLLGVTRIGNRLDTVISISAFIAFRKKYKNYKIPSDKFQKNCDDFLSKLEKGIEYKTYSHIKILRALKKLTNVTQSKKINKRGMFFVKIWLGNYNELLKKHTYYEIKFKKY